MSVYSYRIPPKRKSFLSSFSVNTNIILINVVAFFIFYFLIVSGSLSWDFIAIKPSNIFQGNYIWTFLTSMFMHGSFIHLFVNMFSLFFVGGLVQKLLGPKRYLYFYLSAGLFAAFIFILGGLFYPEDFNTYAVGASGAVFGLIGLLVLLTPNLGVYVMFIPIPIKMKYAGPGMLIALWFVSKAAGLPVGNTAHLGGFVLGIFYGLYLRNKYKNKVKYISEHFS